MQMGNQIIHNWKLTPILNVPLSKRFKICPSFAISQYQLKRGHSMFAFKKWFSISELPALHGDVIYGYPISRVKIEIENDYFWNVQNEFPHLS